MQSSDEIRQKAKSFLQDTQKNDLQLIWILGEIHGAKIYLNWGFRSFGDWYRSEGTGSPSLSHAYALARVGRTFLAKRTEIDEYVESGRINIRHLMELASRHEQGETLEELLPLLTNPPEKTDSHKKDPERGREVRFQIPQADLQAFLSGICNIATYFEVPRFSDALKFLGLDNAGTAKHPGYQDYDKFIENGTFFCAACNNVPLRPNWHHIIPVSVAHGYGPQALLCEECHINIVQPKWRIWAKRWGKKHGFDPVAVEKEGKIQADAGDVDTTPTALITGFPRNISN
jgi:hypothetical protein